MHIKELDSLRGLAAVTVLINHYMIVLPIIPIDTHIQSNLGIVNLLKYSPLHFFLGRIRGSSILFCSQWTCFGNALFFR